jgi:hypothetical protein
MVLVPLWQFENEEMDAFVNTLAPWPIQLEQYLQAQFRKALSHVKNEG